MYFKDLLRYRQAWLGVALLWIILFHLPVDMGPLEWLCGIGYGGVDICFFASGIGCYYSLSSDCDIGNFMKRRLKRLMPTYLVFMIVWLAAKYVTGEFGIQMALGNLLALQHFTGHPNSFNWYVGAALFFYLFAPYFKIIIDRASPVYRHLFVLFLFVCTVPFWQADTFIIAVSRLPVFYIGMLFGSVCQRSEQISVRHVFGAVLSFAAGSVFLAASFIWAPQFLWSYGLYWYPFVLITGPFCMAISGFLICMEKRKFFRPIVSFLTLCGDYSFELYLIHILLISVLSVLLDKCNLSDVSFVWLAGAVPLAAGCYCLRRITALCNQLFSGINMRR